MRTKGETAGPFSVKPFDVMQICGVGVVPKNLENFVFTIIFHLLLATVGTTASTRKNSAFTIFVTIDNAISAILAHGQGCFISKIDIKSAFCICPVWKANWPLLGIKWRDKFYFVCVLPFGLRSSPAIFNSAADAVEWILKHKFSIQTVLHYLVDFLNMAIFPWHKTATLEVQP